MIGRRRCLRLCALHAGLLGLFVGGFAFATTIPVNSLADPGQVGVCALRDAITAANTMTATNGCAAGSGNDTITFRVTGTIKLASTLPEVTDSQLTITGPGAPGITIDGGVNPSQEFTGVQVMQVALGTTLNLNHLTIADGGNFATVGGGGIRSDGTLKVSNSTFSGNECGGLAFAGGAIYSDGSLTVTDSTFSGNKCDALGGAIFNDGSLTVTNTTFSGNRAEPFGIGREGAGGAIYSDGTTGMITNSTFSGNFGLATGGAIDNVGALTVTNSTFSGNQTSVAPFAGPGAGIQNSGTLTVTNSTFSGNGGGSGGGISNGSLASLKNTVLANSSGGLDAPPSNCFGTITDAGYNISDDASCGFSATGSLNSSNPMLSTAGLANNGGPTKTIALQPGSPAIDAIPVEDCTDQALPPNPITTDQRGLLRPDAGEQLCDVGAYEFQDFAGQTGHSNCFDESVSTLTGQFGSLDAAASALGYSSVRALQSAIAAFCRG
jgi:predicted outer membrane repeat protein